MKKEYVMPMMQVYEMRVQGQLLDYSGASLSAPEFNLDDEEWQVPQ